MAYKGRERIQRTGSRRAKRGPGKFSGTKLGGVMKTAGLMRQGANRGRTGKM